MGSPSRVERKIIFNLKRNWEVDGVIVDLYQQIKDGIKTSEWRYTRREDGRLTRYTKLLVTERGRDHILKPGGGRINLFEYIRTNRAWFVVGYPKDNLPRLEADIVGLVYHSDTDQLEIKVSNVEEVLR